MRVVGLQSSDRKEIAVEFHCYDMGKDGGIRFSIAPENQAENCQLSEIIKDLMGHNAKFSQSASGSVVMFIERDE